MQSDVAIRRVLYKYNAPIHRKDKITNCVKIVGKEYIDTAIKNCETEIELGFFTDGRMKEISAIIFSSTATMTKCQAIASKYYRDTTFIAVRYNERAWDTPHVVELVGEQYKESLLDGLHIFVNPFAKNKFDLNLFHHNDIAFHFYNEYHKVSLDKVNDGFLISHLFFTPQDGEKNVNLYNKNINDIKDYSKYLHEGELRELHATVGCGINNHIAHYRNWTIVVFQDSIDNDWSAFAKKCLVYDIQSFISLDEKYDVIQLAEFFDTKENAFNEIKILIDSSIK